MYLQFYINEKGDKVYTTKKESPLGLATQSAHPARFSPDDKFSRQRVLLKKRFGLLPTQQPPPKNGQKSGRISGAARGSVDLLSFRRFRRLDLSTNL
ncbi:hypothetical protein GH714_027182 [Hevea brasiliensis]|uniref:Nucleolar protein 10 n=1 Tax=Hevea brasiliensis TaxID=3981 RepID=A0A6A6KVP9_HEVBR|nr:hypothetical protein GH714_027182 [Hevea brasiliensis]